MRTIEIGAIKLHGEDGEDWMELLGRLAEPLSNKMLGSLLQVNERTIMRMKSAGRLPNHAPGHQLTMIDVVRFIAPAETCDKCGLPIPAGPKD